MSFFKSYLIIFLITLLLTNLLLVRECQGNAALNVWRRLDRGRDGTVDRSEFTFLLDKYEDAAERLTEQKRDLLFGALAIDRRRSADKPSIS